MMRPRGSSTYYLGPRSDDSDFNSVGWPALIAPVSWLTVLLRVTSMVDDALAHTPSRFIVNNSGPIASAFGSVPKGGPVQS